MCILAVVGMARLSELLSNAMLKVAGEQPNADGIQRGADGGDLGEDVDAVAIVLHHAEQAVNLALDTA